MDIARLYDNIAGQRHLTAIRQGLAINIPLFVLGAFSIMVSDISITWYQNVLLTRFDPSWSVFWHTITNASLNASAILTVLSTSYYLARNHERAISCQIHPFVVSLVSFTCLMALIQPFTQEDTIGFPFVWTGVGGIFLALLTALVSTELFLWLCSIKKMTIRLSTDVADPILSQALICMLPTAGTVISITLMKMAANFANIQDIRMCFYAQIEGWFQTIQSPLAELLVFNVIVHSLWFFGMHGNVIMVPILKHIQLADVQATSSLFITSNETQVELTKTFLDTFILIGGVGSTVSLMFALFIASKRGSTKWLLKLSLIPAIFNINELLTFGLPIILNPIFLIPFLLVPILFTFLSYLSISMGVVAPVIHSVHWTTPVFISGYAATNSWSGVLLQLVEIIVGTIIYLPFAIINEQQRIREVKKTFNKLIEDTKFDCPHTQRTIMSMGDGAGTLSRVLAHDLKDAMTKGDLFLEYQPQVNQHNRVVGVEALLRWSHKIYGRVPPPLAISVAEEAGLIHDLGRWIFQAACLQLLELQKEGIEGIRMSVNVSAVQLQSDSFADYILETVKIIGLQPQNIEIEITETIALNNDSTTNKNLSKLRDARLRIAIDDFGMGHTSLRYLTQFYVDTLKIDRILSKDVLSDKNCQEIISSIVSLCSALEIQTIVEYVETECQRDILGQLGCMQYQGYYYSPPLSSTKIIDYILSQNQAEA